MSDRTDRGHDVEGYAADLRAALYAIGEPAVVVAHSMGAKIAQYAAVIDDPARRRVAKLILIAPGIAGAYGMSARHRERTLSAFGSRGRIGEFQRAAMARPLEPQTMERVIEDALLAQREHWFGWYDRGRSADFAARLGAIDVPTFALAGERDPLAPPARVRRELVAKIRGCLFATLRGVGHNIPVEAPDDVAQLVKRFA
jgi:pimeloyl-ACP methyl ester carboxylesterase